MCSAVYSLTGPQSPKAESSDTGEYATALRAHSLERRLRVCFSEHFSADSRDRCRIPHPSKVRYPCPRFMWPLSPAVPPRTHVYFVAFIVLPPSRLVMLARNIRHQRKTCTFTRLTVHVCDQQRRDPVRPGIGFARVGSLYETNFPIINHCGCCRTLTIALHCVDGDLPCLIINCRTRL